MTFLLVVYIIVSLVLSLYGLYQTLILFLYFLQRFRSKEDDLFPPGNVTLRESSSLPFVTIQLPVFNERYVVRRLIDTVARFDYPRDCFQIQVLDDSTDDTVEMCRTAVEYYRAEGLDIECIHRDNRKGFKAGALAESLVHAKGELIAIFDADFIPQPDFLRRLIVDHRAFDDPRIGFVQTRWSFINRHESWLTRVQAIMHDMHFFIDQPARSRNGLFFNFNGSGGIWRRRCIDDAGGWSSDTLAEDLDLSYRAEFAGWRGRFFLFDTSPNELPTTMTAFKRQQTRWARGSVQCARKLIPRVLFGKATLLQKISAIMHMANYSLHMFLVIFILIYPVVLYSIWRGVLVLPYWLGLLGPLCLSYIVTMFIPQTLHAAHTGCKLRYIPLAMCVGVGVSVSNAIAVLKGLFVAKSGVFERTPKEGTVGVIPATPEKRGFAAIHDYFLKPAWTIWAELALAVYCLVSFIILLPIVKFWIFPMFFYAACYFTVGFSQIVRWKMTGGFVAVPLNAET